MAKQTRRQALQAQKDKLRARARASGKFPIPDERAIEIERQRRALSRLFGG